MGTRNKTEKEESAIAKRGNKNLVFNVNSSNTDRPVKPTVDNNKSLSRNSSAEEQAENDVFPSVTAHKNVAMGVINVNSLRNKIGAAQDENNYINENTPCKLINGEIILTDIEMIIFEFLVITRRWLCIGLYKSPSQNENYFLYILFKVLRKQTCQYQNVILIGDFNLTVNNKNLEVFMNTFNLASLINKPTCFQSANPTCID